MPTCRDGLRLVVTAAITCTVGALVHGRAGTLVAVVAAGITAVLVPFTRVAVQHARLARVMRRASRPGRLADLPVRFVTTGAAPMVVGLMRPTIYCDPELTSQLDEEELRAVGLHELAHVRAFDPLRLALLRAVDPALRVSVSGRRFHERLQAEREVLADRFAMARGVTPNVIASALTRLPNSVAPPPLAGFATATDIRLRALLGESAPRPSMRVLWVVIGVVVGAGLCLSAIEPDRLVAMLAATVG